VHADAAALISRGDIDLIVVTTPNDTPEAPARSAILSGKHVVVDKPFALDLVQARALTDLATKRRVLLSVFHNRSCDSDFLSVR
jgi:predicted dehydrogenase